MKIHPDRTTPPPLERKRNVELPSMRRMTLDNGAVMYVLDSRDTEINRISVLLPGGTADAPNPSIALLAAAMQAEGTPTRTAEEIASAIDYNGSWMQANAISHHTRTNLVALPSRMRHVLPIYADTIFNANIPAKELTSVSRELAGAARLRQSAVDFRASELSARLTFGQSHPLAVHATPDDILRCSAREISSFRNRFCRPERMTVFAAGNITPEIEDDINRTLGSVPAATGDYSPPVIFPPQPSAPTVEFTPVEHATQSAISITLPAVPRTHPDYIDLRLTVMALGGYFGSRLSSTIREEEGLTYGIGASLYGYAEGGVVGISTQCDDTNAAAVVDRVRAEMRRLVDEPPGQEELERITRAEATILTEATETPFAVTDFHITMHTAGIGSDYFARRLAAADTITGPRMAEIAGRYLDPDRIIVAIAGNPSKISLPRL